MYNWLVTLVHKWETDGNSPDERIWSAKINVRCADGERAVVLAKASMKRPDEMMLRSLEVLGK